MRSFAGSVAIVASLVTGASGCALLTKSDPLVPRYYTPEARDDASAKPVSAPGPAANLSLRIGRVGGSSYLKERIVYRDSDHELGFYEDKRWTERPETYLQRALERTLFETRGMKRALSSTAPTLTVDLIEFEEERGATPGARLQVSYALHDEQSVFRERSFTIERPLAQGDEKSRANRVAAALGDALRQAVTQIADEVTESLAARQASAPP